MLVQLCRQLGAVPSELGVLGDMANYEQPQFELLLCVFTIAVRRFPQIFIIIDAVDECSDICRLIATLQSMIDWDVDGLHLFFSTRPLPFIRGRLQRLHHLRYMSTTDGNHQDILSLIKARVSERLDWPNTTKESVVRIMAARADGS
jgi:hypothetical protein